MISMAAPLSQKKRDRLFAVWRKKQSIAYVSRTCRCSQVTVRKYRKLDKWDKTLDRIAENARKKLVSKEGSKRVNTLQVAEHSIKCFVASLVGSMQVICPFCRKKHSVLVPKLKPNFRDGVPLLQYYDELMQSGQLDDRPKLIRSPLDISKISGK